MTPLRLHLRNFLSYGEEAPVLDLEGIHVACLSGGNGQGKSALLDAITWAVWGEARKSSEARKPDEELLRIGSRSMEVSFEFSASDAVYRVVRSYQQSASGKTSKPGLEFTVRDGDDWRPLTTGSVRETQAAIDARVGIDYETFINSTFLLQGRSDEFTKKKPGERKEILGKILALGRYERLAVQAGKRWSRLREQAGALEGETERLAEALGPVEEWETERDAVAAIVKDTALEAESAAKEVADAARTLADLDAAKREADAARASLSDLEARATRIESEQARVKERIEAAETLVAQGDQIEADHARYEALRAERSSFDDKATLFRGIEAQRHQITLELEKRKAEAQREIDGLEGALERLDRQISADEATLEDGATARASLAQADKAAADLERMDAVRTKRDAWKERIDVIDKRLAAQKGALEGQRAQVIEEGKRLAAEVAEASAVDLEALNVAVTAGETATARREAIQVEGTEVGALVNTLEAEIERIDADKARLEARRQKLLSSDGEACPTCGTELTEAHRSEVAAGYLAALDALEAARLNAVTSRDKAVTRRDALRAEFASLGGVIEGGVTAARSLSQAEDRATQRAERTARLEVLRADARTLGQRLANEDFEPELRAERTELSDALEGETYDGKAHEVARRDASLREHWQKQVRALDVASERLIEARADRGRRVKVLAERRDQFDQGIPVKDVASRLEVVAKQVESLGYDAQAHEAVSRQVDALSHAPQRLSELLDARRRRAELAERGTRLAEDRSALEAESKAQRARLAALQESLAARAEAEAVHKHASDRRAASSERLSKAQGQLGALEERLARAARDRARLAEARKELRGVKKERALYGHLRRAFGKNGIPSLIIEETLPEIEERANGLLDRLSRGRTRVALETLKDKKTGGGTRETLDIRITDEQGVARSYETFSGGEAFRVNFALRIALSQMLAERSGAQIRTLVIDEGFGTQDAEGLQSLIGAIRAIQDDFETILVITHLDELKDAFPIRIEVRKEPVTGSTFDVIGA